ncbi:hypothetical protein [Plebeiibacterium sediminum]|uniref:Uncharacterized protein n=1 Tax=Plebeiibacterium sediminum TaxID=2992112 RepID=A0AAE3M6A2_9BACT|nr:hypothetical protein [Plebeiobacterium sediminum]MCW3787894.1 hypothetical protein [Plebeiobacterium sediminum]
MKRSKVILLFLFFAIGNYSFGQWSSSGNSIYTDSNEFFLNYTNNPTCTIWLNNNTSGTPSVGHYYIKAYDWRGAYLHFVGTGDNNNERLNVTFDGKVGIGNGNFYEGSLFHIENPVNGWLQTIKGSAYKKDDFIGIKIQTGYMGEYGKFAGIAATTENLHSNLTGLSFFSSSSENMRLTGEGKLGIGTTTPSAKLEVVGDILADEIKVQDIAAANLQLDGNISANQITVKANGNTADFVFSETYNLKDLTEVENFIKTHKHLPDIPSAEEMEASGVNLAEMNKLMLQKVEELMLYTIEQKDELQKEKLERKILENRLSKLELIINGEMTK